MCWKKKLIEIENRLDWKAGVELFFGERKKSPELFYRVLFLLIDFLVEGRYSDEEHDEAAAQLKTIYGLVPKDYLVDPEYLFFMGITIHLAEWYFGYEGCEEAEDMLDRASKLEPENTLFQWGYIEWKNSRPEVNTPLKISLSKRLLFQNGDASNWLNSKGYIGRYVLGLLESQFEYMSSIHSSD